MKARERHQLKENAFAESLAQTMTWLSANQQRVTVVGALVVVLAALAGGYAWWRQSGENRAGALLGTAAALAAAPITPAPTLPGATQPAGTFPTDAARLEAQLVAYREVIAAYPSSEAARTARYALAAALLEAGRAAEAEAAFADAGAAGRGSIYEPLARLGRGEALAAQGKFDDAIVVFTELSADRASDLPLDGVLVHLARASAKAGRTDDARAAFKRIVDEFPTSGYVAEARRELTRLG
jgi:TolA-binding protein